MNCSRAWILETVSPSLDRNDWSFASVSLASSTWRVNCSASNSLLARSLIMSRCFRSISILSSRSWTSLMTLSEASRGRRA